MYSTVLCGVSLKLCELAVALSPAVAERIRERVNVSFGDERPRAISGFSTLPNGAGLMLRVVGIESYDVRAEVRNFWKVVREEARGKTLPEEFLWR